MEPTLWSDKSSLPDTIKQMDNQILQSQDMGNHAEAATWSGHTGPWTYTGGITPSTVLPQSTHLFSTPPFKDNVNVFCTHKMFSPMVDRDMVELEAKRQASAQSTTGTVIFGANKKKRNNVT